MAFCPPLTGGCRVGGDARLRSSGCEVEVAPMHAEHLPTPRQLVATVALLLMGCCLAFDAGPASASHVSCGDRITADTTLDADLVNCPNHGIVIAADDVTLDLNGHLVDGDGTPAAGC